MASGWIQLRGTRRRRGVDRGFPLSDHADWPGLQSAIAATGAGEVWVTHGYTAVMARWLCEHGLEAQAISTRFEGEVEDDPSGAANSDDLPANDLATDEAPESATALEPSANASEIPTADQA